MTRTSATLTERERDKRNLNPHKPAVVAMWIWSAEYSRQKGGSMDFWDSLLEVHKQICRELVSRIEAAPPESVAPVAPSRGKETNA